MTPTISRRNKLQRPAAVQAKVPSRFTSTLTSKDEQIRQFREARLAREKERLEKLRSSRLLKHLNNGSANVSTSVFTTSLCPGPSKSLTQLKSDPVSSKRTTQNVMSVNVKPNTSQSNSSIPSSIQSSSLRNATNKPAHTQSFKNQKNSIKLPSSSSTVPAPTLKVSYKSRKSLNEKKNGSMLKKADIKGSTAKKSKNTRHEVKLTKTAQLRLLKSDPLLQPTHFMPSTSSSKCFVLPPPVSQRQASKAPSHHNSVKFRDLNGQDNADCSTDLNKQECKVPLKKTSFAEVAKVISSDSPSRIPVRQNFVSPQRKMIPLTPKPSPLREKLAEWLEKRSHSLENFKHLKCFGILGPLVKRPQTPFRKVALSTSMLKAIPEIIETTPAKETFEESSHEETGKLNTTFTLEDEDKENISCNIGLEPSTPIRNIELNTQAENIKQLDQASGVLSELHKIIKMGYPVDQCHLWLRAVRRRFPQCGDEPVYWECLASLEEARGDFQTALSCYEQALSQGGKSPIKNSVDELLKKMTALQIEPVFNSSLRKTKLTDKALSESSNVIRSSSIQFAVQEKSSKKIETSSTKDDSTFIATPVRRSGRLAGTPTKSTPGITCVRSLEFLEPKVRNSLTFCSNRALDPTD